MALKAARELREKEVLLMCDAEAQFVSLVRHGANQAPFKVVKSEDKGGENVSMIIQSIIVPNAVTLDALAAKSELAWLNDVSRETVEDHGEYKKFVQFPAEKFDQSTMTMKKLDEASWAVVGKMLDSELAKQAVTVPVQKQMDVPIRPMDIPVAEEQITIPFSFGELFDRELYNFTDVVKGALSAQGWTAKARKQAVMNALDAFKTFVSAGLDALDEKAIGKCAEWVEKSPHMQKVEESTTSKSTEVDEMELFKTKEEFVEAVKAVLVADREAVAAVTAAKADADAKEQEKQTLANAITAMATSIKAVQDAVTRLTAKQDEICSQIGMESGAGDAAAASDDAAAAAGKETAKKSDDKLSDADLNRIITDKSIKPDLSVFGGMLGRRG